MEFKKWPLKLILVASLLGVFLLGLMIWEFFLKADVSPKENIMELPLTPIVPNPVPVPETAKEDDAAIQEQLDRDREEQKQTKNLKIKLEQTDLELEQEKALAEINKLKKDNRGAFNEPAVEGDKNLPEIKVDYIGGDSLKKEAIVSIDGASFQVKEKSSPIDNIQVVSISDSSVTLHFSAPQELTKTIDYKPE